MCGIVGFTGKNECVDILIDGLKALEYRGYDSAGIAVQTEAGIAIRKTEGKVERLEQSIGENPVNGSCGIGHTRWATHGEPTGINAHPHTDTAARLAIVHNGIIENYAELRGMLMEKGIEFVSETDTEVAAKLLGYLYTGDMVSDLERLTQLLQGSYAIAAVAADTPGKIYCVCKDAPIVLGKNEYGSFIASDISAILTYTRDVYYLKSGVIAAIDDSELNFYDELGNSVELRRKHIDWDIEAAQKGKFEHFMLKEIHEQPSVIEKLLDIYCESGRLRPKMLKLTADRAKSISRIRIVSCGTAYHAGLVAKQYIEKLAGIPVDVEVASEFRYGNALIDKNEEIILISQSGETADTIAALKLARECGCHTTAVCNVLGSTISRLADEVLYTHAGPEISVASTKAYTAQLAVECGCHTTAVCNVLGSTISRLADEVLYTHAGPEISVASTKAYTAQLAVLLLMAVDIAVKAEKISDTRASELIAQLSKVPQIMQQQLEEKDSIQYLASRCVNIKNVFFIGRGIDYALAMEGALKLKEVSYIHSEAYAAGELKHGTIALIEDGVFFIGRGIDYALAMEGALKLKEVSYIHSEAYAAGELKHGTIALIEDGTLVIALATQPELLEKMASNMQETRVRGAYVVAITCGDWGGAAHSAQKLYPVHIDNSLLSPFSVIVPLQLIAYYFAVERGRDVDKPRNLAKSVTVE